MNQKEMARKIEEIVWLHHIPEIQMSAMDLKSGEYNVDGVGETAIKEMFKAFDEIHSVVHPYSCRACKKSK